MVELNFSSFSDVNALGSKSKSVAFESGINTVIYRLHVRI